MSESEPKIKLAFNPTATQWWLWLLSKTTAIVFAVYLGIQWLAGVAVKAEIENCKPKIFEEVDHRIEVHRLAAEGPFIERIHEIESHNVAIDEKLEAMKETQNQVQGQIGRMDRKLDRILANGDHP